VRLGFIVLLRERFERDLAKRDTGNYRSKAESKGRAAPNPEYQERKMSENKDHDVDTRTPSLSPEPDIDRHEYGRWKEGCGIRENKEKKVLNREKLREKSDKDNCGTKYKKEEEYRSYQYHKNVEVSQRERSYDRGGKRELSSYDGHHEEDARGQDEHQDGLDKPRQIEVWKQDGERGSRDRSRGRDLVDVQSRANESAIGT
jgi:hypothetical protein